MSLEQKIADLMAKRTALQESVASATLPGSNDNGEKTSPPQGSSAEAEVDELDEKQPGVDAAAKATQETPPQAVGDATSVSIPAMESVDLKAEVAGLFEGVEGLEDGFVTKATGIFEAAVIARVNAEVIKLTEQLEAKAETELEALKKTLSEQVDKYIGYVVENWVKENQVAIDAGLRTEIAESFIESIKTAFVENYIQVPEEKVDILEQASKELSESKTQLDRLIAENADLKAQKVALEKTAVLEEVSKELSAMDAERLVKLVEGVDFESKELFAEKVAVIREAHFKKPAKKTAETMLVEGADGTGSEPAVKAVDPVMKSYLDVLGNKTGFSK